MFMAIISFLYFSVAWTYCFQNKPMEEVATLSSEPRPIPGTSKDKQASENVKPSKVLKRRRPGSDSNNNSKRMKKTVQQPDIAGDGEDRTPCMFCEVEYCKSNVKWYKCKNCHQWACGKCAGMGARKKVYVCHSCK
jgi:hypothetical protein